MAFFVAEMEEVDMPEVFLLTQTGYDKIVADYEELITVKRKEVAERIKEAISYGDISENSEYDSAKNEQAELEERIMKLENMMRNAKIIDHDKLSEDNVEVGLSVRIRDLSNNKDIEYTIVGSTEADPFEGKISNESEVGKQLLGKKVGDKIDIHVPAGAFTYEIMEIFR